MRHAFHIFSALQTSDRNKHERDGRGSAQTDPVQGKIAHTNSRSRFMCCTNADQRGSMIMAEKGVERGSGKKLKGRAPITYYGFIL